MTRTPDPHDNDKPREECALFGCFGVPDAASVLYRGLFAQQHRGQEGAGIVVSDGRQLRGHRGLGLVSEVFCTRTLADMPGRMGIAHARYSTTGSPRLQNVQPLTAECVDGTWAIAHNGNLINAGKLRRMYQEAGAIFQTSTDSEVLVHVLADPMFRARPQRVARALGELRGAFAFLLMTRDCLLAARDPLGFKPLSIGRLDTGWVAASETCALTQVGATPLRDVQPGELVVIDEAGMRSSMFAEPPPHLAQCIFEHVYFARPDSIVFGERVHAVRHALGVRLAEEHPADADIVIPVPDSGNFAALGFAQRSGIPLDYGFIRNHYIGRTFIMPTAAKRAESVDMKLSVVAGVVRDKRVVVVDDSIIRGTTSRRRVSALRAAGAREVHMRISCPPTRHPCYFGIDFPTSEELVAANRTPEEIGAWIGADSIGYLSADGLLSPFQHPSDFCTACFGGRYPVEITGKPTKEDLENNTPFLPLDPPVGDSP